MSELGSFESQPFPLWWPTRTAWKGRLAELDGSIPRLAAEVLERAGISITVRQADEELLPENYPWNDSERGTLLVGCHRLRNEPAFVAALLGRTAPLKSLHAFAKPYAFLSQGVAELARRDGGTGRDDRIASTLLPVVPGSMLKPFDWKGLQAVKKSFTAASQRLFWRAGMRRPLPTAGEITANNQQAFKKAAAFLGEGAAVLIFPTGKIADATTAAWHSGVGRLVADCNTRDIADKVDIVPFRFGRYHPWRAAAAVMFGNRSNLTVDLELAPSYTAAELFEDVAGNPAEGSLQETQRHLGSAVLTQAITQAIRNRYRAYFAPPQAEAPAA